MATRTMVQQTCFRPTNHRTRGFRGNANTACDMRNNPVKQAMNHNYRAAPTQGRPLGHMDHGGPPRPMGAQHPFHQRLREEDRAVNVRYAPQNMHQGNTWAPPPNQSFNNSCNIAASRQHCPRASAPNHFGQGSQTQHSRNLRFQQRPFDGFNECNRHTKPQLRRQTEHDRAIRAEPIQRSQGEETRIHLSENPPKRHFRPLIRGDMFSSVSGQSVVNKRSIQRSGNGRVINNVSPKVLNIQPQARSKLFKFKARRRSTQTQNAEINGCRKYILGRRTAIRGTFASPRINTHVNTRTNTHVNTRTNTHNNTRNMTAGRSLTVDHFAEAHPTYSNGMKRFRSVRPGNIKSCWKATPGLSRLTSMAPKDRDSKPRPRVLVKIKNLPGSNACAIYAQAETTLNNFKTDAQGQITAARYCVRKGKDSVIKMVREKTSPLGLKRCLSSTSISSNISTKEVIGSRIPDTTILTSSQPLEIKRRTFKIITRISFKIKPKRFCCRSRVIQACCQNPKSITSQLNVAPADLMSFPVPASMDLVETLAPVHLPTERPENEHTTVLGSLLLPLFRALNLPESKSVPGTLRSPSIPSPSTVGINTFLHRGDVSSTDRPKLTSLDLTYFDDVDLTPNQNEAPASKNSPQPAMGVYLDTAFNEYTSNDSYSTCTSSGHMPLGARDGRDSNITRASSYITGDGKTVHVTNYVQITRNYTVSGENVVCHGTMNITGQGNGGELSELDSNADADAQSDGDTFDCDSATGGTHCVLGAQFEVNVTVQSVHESVGKCDTNGQDSKGEGPTNVFDLESECRISLHDIESDSSLHVYDSE
ncbi:unnamed protein product [Lymnaea stagnalis]|uniref:Uncharacterized protein n=1 Tax=Lymnaea stagnalis TaxID=6523 RepID=A0AAV2HNA4_LYMST